jgi:hypothetical protein
LKKLFGRGVTLTKKQRERADWAAAWLDDYVRYFGCNIHALSEWAVLLGFKGLIFSKEMSDTIPAAIAGGWVVVKSGLDWIDMVLCIAHEDCHKSFHGDCIATRDLNAHSNERNETHAELYASVVALPYIEVQPLDDDESILMHCKVSMGFSDRLGELRFAHWKKHGE